LRFLLRELQDLARALGKLVKAIRHRIHSASGALSRPNQPCCAYILRQKRAGIREMGRLGGLGDASLAPFGDLRRFAVAGRVSISTPFIVVRGSISLLRRDSRLGLSERRRLKKLRLQVRSLRASRLVW